MERTERRGRKPTVETNPGHRTCKFCKVEKPYSELRTRMGKYGLLVENCCIACNRARAVQHYWKDPEKYKQKATEWRAKNRDRKRAYGREYVIKNRDKINAQFKKHTMNLTDTYIRQCIAKSRDGKSRTISASSIPQSLVEVKRLQLLIIRSLKDEAHK